MTSRIYKRVSIGESTSARHTYTLLEQEKVVLGQSVGFGDDGYEIDTRSQSFHDLNVKRLQTEGSDV